MKTEQIPSTSLYVDLISSVNFIRSKLNSIQVGKLSIEDFNLIRITLAPFQGFKTIAIFLEDCEKSIDNLFDFSNTRDFVFEKIEPIVISFFKVPYNTNLGLDAFIYELEIPDRVFVDKFKTSMASTISITNCTDGFDQYPTCVALFPENFCATKAVKNQFSVFYFLNVFVRRFEEYGRPILEKYVSKRSFWRLKRLSQPELLKSFATWHYLHEYFHSTGHLPLVDYFNVKNTKKTGALEELRVDALSIIECLDNAQNGFADAYYYAELILFERLLRYSVHLDPQENYDARSSLIFFNFLEEQAAISIDNNFMLDIQKSKLKESLISYVNEISALEIGIKNKLKVNPSANDYKLGRLPLMEFAEKYSGKDEVKKNKYLEHLYNDSMNVA